MGRKPPRSRRPPPWSRRQPPWSRRKPPWSPATILALLTLANVLNFYDRAIPAIIVEPIKAEFGLTDASIGLVSASFTVVYAAAGIVLGRLADRGARRKVMAGGLVAWSLFTALSGGAWSLTSLIAFRLGVGIGEASYAPAANATVVDTFHPDHRSRAVSVLQLGMPVGLLLAFVTVGPIVEATGSWRLPFVLAAIPGFVLAVVLWRMPEPEPGASEDEPLRDYTARNTPDALLHLMRVPTVRWIILSGVGTQIASYAVATFFVPLLQRYFGLALGRASLSTGAVIGVTGVLGLLVGGWLADRASRTSPRARLQVGVLGMTLATPLVAAALLVPRDQPMLFSLVMGVGWMFNYFMSTVWVPALADVVEPHLRATAVALAYAVGYLVGAAFGPVLAGLLSDQLTAWVSRGVPHGWWSHLVFGGPGLAADARGLHVALLVIVPISLAWAAGAAWWASRWITADHHALLATQGPTGESTT